MNNVGTGTDDKWRLVPNNYYGTSSFDTEHSEPYTKIAQLADQLEAEEEQLLSLDNLYNQIEQKLSQTKDSDTQKELEQQLKILTLRKRAGCDKVLRISDGITTKNYENWGLGVYVEDPSQKDSLRNKLLQDHKSAFSPFKRSVGDARHTQTEPALNNSNHLPIQYPETDWIRSRAVADIINSHPRTSHSGPRDS